MKIITYLDDPDDLSVAMRAVKDTIRNGYKECAYHFGGAHNTPGATAFTRQNKTGWTVYVQREASEAPPL